MSQFAATSGYGSSSSTDGGNGVAKQKRDPANRRSWPGSAVRAAREQQGLTQEELAVRLDVSLSTVRGREAGRLIVYREAWLATTAALGLPIDWEPKEPEEPRADDTSFAGRLPRAGG